jgi:hypothetical protein
MADKSKYYIVKSNDTQELEWNQIKNMYVVAQKAYYNTINRPPREGQDPEMILRQAAMQFEMDCNDIKRTYQDRFEKDQLPVPVTINGKQKNVINGEEYILLKDPTANFQDSFIDETGYDSSKDRAIHNISNKTQYNDQTSARLVTQFWTN